MVLKEDDIEFIVLTRSAGTNPKKFAPFTITVDKYDTMAILREQIVVYCHSAHDINMDKIGNTTLKIVDGQKHSAVFPIGDDDIEIGNFMHNHDLLVAPFTIVMPLNTEGVGGGT